LTVDHGLRPESRAEAVTVAQWLGALGVRHEILTWTGEKPSSALQARARAARHALLAERCRREGVLHLLLAHQRDDQAETVALRQARRSGPDGLAGMAPVRELAGMRLLRPLLGVAKARLVATLEAGGQPWLDDPSNRAPEFARSHLRGHAQVDGDALVARAASCAIARAELDSAVAAWLVTATRIDPSGFVLISAAALRQAPGRIARRALQQALRVAGGGTYPPREERLGRLLEALVRQPDFSGRTLAGCRILPRGGDILICREPAAIGDAIRAQPGTWQAWDRRFALRLSGEAVGLTLAALGEDGWRERRRLRQADEGRNLPPPVGPGLPAVWQGGRLVMVPHLNLRAPDLPAQTRLEARFRPAGAFAGPRFARL
jgi:tRNA(Ile)-lysidine synthase